MVTVWAVPRRLFAKPASWEKQALSAKVRSQTPVGRGSLPQKNAKEHGAQSRNQIGEAPIVLDSLGLCKSPMPPVGVACPRVFLTNLARTLQVFLAVLIGCCSK